MVAFDKGQHALGYYARRFFRCAGEQNRKLIAAVAHQAVGPTAGLAEEIGDLADADIAVVCSGQVGVLREAIDVGHQDRKNGIIPVGAADFLGQPNLQVGAVEETAHLIQ